MTMRELTLWLASLPLSSILRRSSWAIPAMQTAHILSLGTLLAAIVMIDLRIWGYARAQTLAKAADEIGGVGSAVEARDELDH